MRYANRVAPLPLFMSLLSACSSGESQLDTIAVQLREAVNRCVLDVSRSRREVRKFHELPLPRTNRAAIRRFRRVQGQRA
jgi:hypothetical protein